jgi:quercetin dioxygenase-like cupin family protein
VHIRSGDIVHALPDEWHWHGATPDDFMTHLSVTEGVGESQKPESEWGALVTDTEYGGSAKRT